MKYWFKLAYGLTMGYRMAELTHHFVCGFVTGAGRCLYKKVMESELLTDEEKNEYSKAVYGKPYNKRTPETDKVEMGFH